MTISIVIFVNKELALVGMFKKMMANVESLEYSKGKMEVLFFASTEQDKGTRRIENIPPVRIFFLKPGHTFGKVLNIAMKEARADVVVFADLNTVFENGKFLAMIQSFEQVENISVFNGNGWFAVRRGSLTFPDDVFCARSYAVLKALTSAELPVGGWGKLHKKEIERFIYVLDRLDLKDRARIFFERIRP